MGDFERTFGAGTDAVDIISGRTSCRDDAGTSPFHRDEDDEDELEERSHKAWPSAIIAWLNETESKNTTSCITIDDLECIAQLMVGSALGWQARFAAMTGLSDRQVSDLLEMVRPITRAIQIQIVEAARHEAMKACEE